MTELRGLAMGMVILGLDTHRAARRYRRRTGRVGTRRFLDALQRITIERLTPDPDPARYHEVDHSPREGPMVRGLPAGGKRIRTFSPASRLFLSIVGLNARSCLSSSGKGSRRPKSRASTRAGRLSHGLP